MPPSAATDTEPDWPGIRAASVAIGVRAAARRASAHLPAEEQTRFVERVMKRSSREGWIVAKEAAKAAVIPRGQPLSANVRTGAETLSSELAEDSKETRLSLSRSARRLAQEAESAPLEQAGDALQVGKLAALVHGWSSQQPTLRISMFGSHVDGLEALHEGPVIDLVSEGEGGSDAVEQS